MRTRIFAATVLTLALVAIVLVVIPERATISAENSGFQIWGTWVWLTHLGGGATLPAMVTYHQDGTLVVSDGAMFGGLPGPPNKFTPYHGVWVQAGPKSFGGTSLALSFDAYTGILIGFVRTRSTIQFADNPDQLQGTFFMDVLACPTPLTCPDPFDSAASWQSYPAMPPGGFLFTATRVRRLPAGPL